MAFATLLFNTMAAPSNAEDYSCLQPPDTYGTEPTWVTSSAKDLKFVVSWAFKDTEKCIVGMADGGYYGNNFMYPKSFGEFYQFPTTWTVTRDGEMALVSAEVEFPLALLRAQTHLDNDTSWTNFFQTNQEFDVYALLKIRNASKYSNLSINGQFGLAQLWGHWFSKNQEIFPTNCKPINIQHNISKLESKVSWKITEPGKNPKVEISLTEDSDCIFLVHAGPLESFKTNTGFTYEANKTLAEYAFWDGQGSAFFNKILSIPDQIIQVGLGDFTEEKPYNPPADSSREITKVTNVPNQIISHKDSIYRSQNVIKVISEVDTNALKDSSTKNLTLYLGFYSWHQYGGASFSSGWDVKFSGSRWTATYSKGGSVPGGSYMVYQTRAIKIPVADLITSAADRAAAAELIAKQEADAKAAKDKAAAELKIKQESEIKAKQEADAKAAADLKAKQEADAKAAANKEAAEKAERDAYLTKLREDAEKAIAAEKLLEAKKKTTITCVKGKSTKKVTAVKPKCPSGYKKKQ